jgi:N-hydroxyarylamine O-acetyltransferase
MGLNLDAYFDRIGYAGVREPTLEVLRSLHSLHPAAIPFENLDPLLGRPVRLDLASLEAKLVGEKRGGYCFEQNGLLRGALETLGFAVTPLIARVVWMRAADQPLGPRNHMLLRVDIDGEPWIADVGFGGQIASAPLRLAPDIEQKTPEATFRFVRVNEAFELETLLPTGWTALHRFTLERAEQADYEVGNWFTSTHPDVIFTHNLLAQHLTPEMRTSLFNTKLTRRRPDGDAEVVELANPEELARAMVEELGMAPPADAAALFARLPKEAHG